MRIKIKNDSWYTDGHSSSTIEELDLPPVTTEIDCWAADHLFPLTGDGHGVDSKLGSVYTITVLESDEPLLVGEEFEWID